MKSDFIPSEMGNRFDDVYLRIEITIELFIVQKPADTFC